MFKKALWQGLVYVFAFLLAFVIIVACVLEENRVAVDGALGTVSEIMVSEDDGTLYKAFTPPEELLNKDGTGNSTALISKAIDLGRRQEAEGAVLLKNNGALPLSTGSKVTLLGARSQTSIINSGMGQKSQGPYITLAQALSATSTDFAHTSTNNTTIGEFAFSDLKYGGNGVAAGAGFQVNGDVLDKYAELNTASKLSIQPSAPGLKKKYDPQEPARAEVEETVNATCAAFGDAAIVVVGRGAGESNDYIKGNVTEGLGFDEPLQLSKNERDIIELATEKFDKVIVLLNNNSAIEVGDLKNNEKIDSILWFGHPGNYGFLGVADILSGKVNPSGGLYDIYATNNLSAPAMQNMGDYTFANASELVRSNRSSKYLMETESIYTGYRYYETRYYDTLVNPASQASSATGAYSSKNGWTYDEEVAYGFGYGMSYTDFSYELVGTPKLVRPSGHEIYADFTVKVTNKGTTAGKTSVQVYGQAPYTAYDKSHNVEKSAIQLLAFDKTDLIEKGKSETVDLTVDLQNLASYDNTFKNADGTTGTWILEEGDYYFSVGNGAHAALNNIIKAQGHTPDTAADEKLVWKWNYDYAGSGQEDGTTFGISKNNRQVSNQLDYIDWNHFGGEKVKHLSRSNWADTYPVEHKDAVIPNDMKDMLNGKYYSLKKSDDVSDIKWDSTDTNYKFYQMIGSDFDDYRWDALLSQLNLAEATAFAELGGPRFYALTGVDFVQRVLTENAGNGVVKSFKDSLVSDAPWAIGESDPNYLWNGQVFGCAPIMASTFDPDIMFEIGEFVAIEELFIGYPIVWGPGLNTHRHAYNGRNGEYYSEDPVLSGVAAMEFAVGARDYGLIAAAKHFVFNDQETNRNGVAPFMTEQRAREIELRAYQVAIEAVKYNRYNAVESTVREKQTGLYGLMTSFSKVGPVEVTCSYGMLTAILQNEWGFTGYAVSDIGDDRDLFSSAVYAGLTGFDNRGSKATGPEELANMAAQLDSGAEKGTVDGTYFAGDATLQKTVKHSIKRTLWALSNSNLMNQYTSTTHTESVMVWWRSLYVALIAVFAVLTAAGVALYTISVLKSKKEA